MSTRQIVVVILIAAILNAALALLRITLIAYPRTMIYSILDDIVLLGTWIALGALSGFVLWKTRKKNRESIIDGESGSAEGIQYRQEMNH